MADTGILQSVLDRVNSRACYASEPDGQDYWQTPAELYASGRGDCEDFAIAYWCELARPDARLAWLLPNTQPPVPHVVCFVGGPDPWVLDVLADEPYRLSERSDLLIVWAMGDPPGHAAGVAALMASRVADVQARISAAQA